MPPLVPAELIHAADLWFHTFHTLAVEIRDCKIKKATNYYYCERKPAQCIRQLGSTTVEK